MIDSIYIAMTGLNGFERGLRVIANNTTNLNTPGFKSATLQYADLFYNNALGAGPGGSAQYGLGLSTLGTTLSFTQGELQSTDSALDVAVDGLGLFVLRNDAGQLRYTRDGQFKLDKDHVLVSSVTEEPVMALSANGALERITLDDLRTQASHATETVTFGGNLDSTQNSVTVGTVTVVDATGTSHTLSARFDAVAATPGTWNVTVLDGTTELGTGQIAFIGGVIDPAHSSVAFSYTPAGQAAMQVTLGFSGNVSSYESGGSSTLAVASQDGYAAGSLTAVAFDETGTMRLTYSNGQTIDGPQLALARFDSQDGIRAVGDAEFEATDPTTWRTGVAGSDGFGSIRSKMVETSNVNLSNEFSDLVVMQRGYQASSQVISTANDMISELFAMRGK